MDRLRVRIKDKRICGLVKAFLKSGVMTAHGDREETLTGTPQGGILSPLLANIALSVLDDVFAEHHAAHMATSRQRQARKKQGLANWRLIRYCDDFVVMVTGNRQHAEELCGWAATVLAKLGLRLSPEKTQVVHIDEGFDFLGFHIRRMRKRGTQKQYVYTAPSKKSIQSIKDKVRAKTYRSTLQSSLRELLISLNQTLRGWANYFRYGVSKDVFGAVDSYAWRRIASWLARKHSRLSRQQMRRRFCQPGTWKIAHDGIAFTGASSVVVTRYRYRGHHILSPWTPAPAALTG